jgi:hypothetical protein
VRVSRSNEPKGRGYNEAFGLWLKRNEFDHMDKVLRAALLDCITNLIAIEQWRKTTLSPTQRAELNNPRVVLRRWRASLHPEKAAGATAARTAGKAATAKKLLALFKRVRFQSKQHVATISKTELALIASEGERLLREWVEGDEKK